MNTPEAEKMEYERAEYLARLRCQRCGWVHGSNPCHPHAELRERNETTVRELLKQTRFALNAFNDGCPELACEILGDTLRAYGEEQP